jgi:hypothetical protein
LLVCYLSTGGGKTNKTCTIVIEGRVDSFIIFENNRFLFLKILQIDKAVAASVKLSKMWK